MGKDHIHIIGAGGHAKVVLDAIIDKDPEAVVSVYDNHPDILKKMIFGQYEIQDQNALKLLNHLHIAIGDNKIRENVALKFSQSLSDLQTIIHKKSIVSSSSIIKEGCFVAAGAIVGPDSLINHGTIVNHMAIVDHDCQIGSWVHIAPNATLGGGVMLDDGVFVGAGSVVLPGIRVGKNSIVGAGAVVTQDVPDGSTVIGIPAKGKLK